MLARTARATNWATYMRFPAYRDAGRGDRAPYRFRRSDILAYKARRGTKPAVVPLEMDPAPAENGDLITTTRAAAILAVNRATVHNWGKDGRFPVVRYEHTGRNTSYRDSRSDTLAYLDRLRLPARSAAADGATEADG